MKVKVPERGGDGSASVNGAVPFLTYEYHAFSSTSHFTILSTLTRSSNCSPIAIIGNGEVSTFNSCTVLMLVSI